MSENFTKLLGAILQGIVVGACLFIAILELIAVSGGTVTFRYQGF